MRFGVSLDTLDMIRTALEPLELRSVDVRVVINNGKVEVEDFGEWN